MADDQETPDEPDPHANGNGDPGKNGQSGGQGPKENGDRDPAGRFVKGNRVSVGNGRPRGPSKWELRDYWGEKKCKLLADKLWQLAYDGDPAMVREAMVRAFGKGSDIDASAGQETADELSEYL